MFFFSASSYKQKERVVDVVSNPAANKPNAFDNT